MNATTVDEAASLFAFDRQAARPSGTTLVSALVGSVEAALRSGQVRSGQRLPSIRELSRQSGVSFSTAVAAYDRLVALGLVEARSGSGFYARTRAEAPPSVAPTLPLGHRHTIDSSWLVRGLRDVSSLNALAGSGVFPDKWLDESLIAKSLRAIGRQQLHSLVRYGEPAGFAPLRAQLKLKLADIGIEASAQQIVLTCGITHAIDVVAQALLKPGDAVLVDDPGWFVLFGRLRSLGLTPLGVPWRNDGPDLDVAEQLAKAHKPRLFITNSVLHNPTGASISVSKAHRLLRLAESNDFMVLENDAYGDLATPGTVRIAALDQLHRVVYAGGFSKTLSPGLRVGYIACRPSLVDAFIDYKMHSTLTSPELNERIVQRVLSEGHYRSHIAMLNSRLDRVREPALARLERVGVGMSARPTKGIFAWVDAHCDTSALAQRAAERGYVLAPGQLFSPSQEPSTMMRINIAACSNAALLNMLKEELAR